MSLSGEYQRQLGWRSWETVFDALPSLSGRTVLDLGCAVGDQAAALVDRGAYVIGLDANEELLEKARSKELENAEFRSVDLRTFNEPGTTVDGLWCSFTAAYFPNLSEALASWGTHLAPGGWIALTEIDDLFAHEPLSDRTRALLEGFVRDALLAGRYDFSMGRRLADHAREAGFRVSKTLVLEDREFSFHGPAEEGVVAAWRERFDRMKLLRDFCGPEFETVRDEFLDCLTQTDHRSGARVIACVATR